MRRAGTIPSAGVVVGLVAMTVACTGGGEDGSVVATLSADEVDAGWQLLFDGRTMAGWKAYGGGPVPSGGWRVMDGLLVAGTTSDSAGPRGDIVTEAEFGDFELQLEFKLSADANSGVFYRVVEDSALPMWSVAPEYQILDDPAYIALGDGFDPATHLTGDNYDLHDALHRALRPVGQWNQARIVVRGARVDHWLNGERTVSYELWSPEWEARVDASKFAAFDAYGRARQGAIGLQDHDPGHVWFRNIKVRRLEP